MARRLRTSLGTIAFGLCAIITFVSCGTSSGGAGGSATAGPGGLCERGCNATQRCDPALGCVECTSDAMCPAGQPRCVLGSCEVCASNGDCPASAPACYPSDHRCHAACTVDTCPKNLVCDTMSGACVGCKAGTDCAGTPQPFCSPATGECVACLANTDCGTAAPFCIVRTGQMCHSACRARTAAPQLRFAGAICDAMRDARRTPDARRTSPFAMWRPASASAVSALPTASRQRLSAARGVAGNVRANLVPSRAPDVSRRTLHRVQERQGLHPAAKPKCQNDVCGVAQ